MRKKAILILLVLIQMIGCLALTASAESSYCVNGVWVRYDDFTSRPGACRVYAGKLYQKIWGTEFSSDFYDSDNMLRNLEDEELTLTEEHLKEYVTQAQLGAAIRVGSKYYLHRNDGSAGHTQLIVQKDENGFTVLEGGMSDYPYYREYYYTWSEFVNADWLGGRYGYIKYIKWPGAAEYDPDYDAEAPQVSDVEITIAEDYSGFSLTFEAIDDVEVREVYFKVWPQGSTEAEAEIISCQLDGRVASGTVSFPSFGTSGRNFYVRCFAVDGRGNSDRADPVLVSLYPLDAEFRGYCQVLVDDAPVRRAPAEELSRMDTQSYTVEKGSVLSVTGLYRDEQGVRWYRLSDGMWVRERDVRYDTFTSFLYWAFDDRNPEHITWLNGQILFTVE